MLDDSPSVHITGTILSVAELVTCYKAQTTKKGSVKAQGAKGLTSWAPLCLM